MQQKFKLPEQTHFILFGEALDKINRGGSHAMSLGYVDNANALGRGVGVYVEYITSKDQRGNPKAKRFKWDESFRKIMTRPSDRDITGLSQFEYLKNSPECEGSPNGFYQKIDGQLVQLGVVYREFNPEKDAENALEADTV